MTDIPNRKDSIIVGITGASGSILASKTINALLDKKIPTIVVASGPARVVWQQEMLESFGEAIEKWAQFDHFNHYALGEISAPIASGTVPVKGMAIIPSSMATVSGVANGLSDNLIRRAADVCLKEKRPLVMVPRESPLNEIHLANLTKLARYGVTILPSDPPFYLPLLSVEDAAGFTAQRVLLALGVIDMLPREMQYKRP